MKQQDQQLAKKFWHLQLELQKMRLVRSCTSHQALVEEVTCGTDERKILMNIPQVSDTPEDASNRSVIFFHIHHFDWK